MLAKYNSVIDYTEPAVYFNIDNTSYKAKLKTDDLWKQWNVWASSQKLWIKLRTL